MGFANNGNIVEGAAHNGRVVAGAAYNGQVVFENFKKVTFSCNVVVGNVPPPPSPPVAGATAEGSTFNPRQFRGRNIESAGNLIAFGDENRAFNFGIGFEGSRIADDTFVQRIELEKAGFIQKFDTLYRNNNRWSPYPIGTPIPDATGGFYESGAWIVRLYYKD